MVAPNSDSRKTQEKSQLMECGAISILMRRLQCCYAAKATLTPNVSITP
jgi:hypothetical protein